MQGCRGTHPFVSCEKTFLFFSRRDFLKNAHLACLLLAFTIFPAARSPQEPDLSLFDTAKEKRSYEHVNALPETANLVMHIPEIVIQKSQQQNARPHLEPLVTLIKNGIQELKQHPRQAVTKTVLLQSNDTTKTLFAELIFAHKKDVAGKMHITYTLSFKGLSPQEPKESALIITRALDLHQKPPPKGSGVKFLAGGATAALIATALHLFTLKTTAKSPPFATPQKRSQTTPTGSSSQTIKDPQSSSYGLNPQHAALTVRRIHKGRKLFASPPQHVLQNEENHASFNLLGNIFYAIAGSNPQKMIDFFDAYQNLDQAFLEAHQALDEAENNPTSQQEIVLEAKHILKRLTQLFNITPASDLTSILTSEKPNRPLNEQEKAALREILLADPA